MPLPHRHAHPQRDLSARVGDIVDGDAPAGLVKKSPQNGGSGGNEGGDIKSEIPTAIERPTATDIQVTEIAKATGEASLAPTDNIAADRTMEAPTSAPTNTSSDDSSVASGGDGTSAGVKAGIAFGVLGGVLIIGLLVYFAFSRRKGKKGGHGNGEEKFTSVGAPPPPMKDRSKTPRLSLRPVTQFFPQLNGGQGGSSVAPPRPSPGYSPFERPSTSQSTHPSNPFGNQAERAPSPITEEHSMHTRSTPPTPDRSTKPLPAGRQASMYGDRTRKIDLTLPDPIGPPSPAGTEFSMSSVTPGAGPGPASSGAAAIAAAGGPKNTSVHRVQLDFKPSLEDEMELKAGELVRLLHEYDDGWALCIRLDRSRQGVVPRTCLSTRPVKPRAPQGGGPRGPPVNPQGGHRAAYSQDRSESPARPKTSTGPGSGRPMSPAGRPMSPAGRPQSPGPRYPGQPAGRPRAPSKSHGPSPMNPGSRPGPSPGPPPGMAM